MQDTDVYFMLVLRYFSFAADMGDEFMRLRKQALGDRNLIGARVELAKEKTKV